MDLRRAAIVVGSCALLGALAKASVSDQQPPDATAAPFAAGAAHWKPVNLQVLPPDISSAELGRLMKGFERDLGVTCSHCHVEEPAARKFDYASDENPAKAQARLMISMLKDINDRYLAQLGGDRRYAVPVTCGSCHQGQSSPPAFEPRDDHHG
jgi:Photosynthetic reaction centre cytochrome C subunit